MKKLCDDFILLMCPLQCMAMPISWMLNSAIKAMCTASKVCHVMQMPTCVHMWVA